LIGICCIASSSTPTDVDAPVWKREILRSAGPAKPRSLQGQIWDKNRAGVVFLNDQQLLTYGVYEENKGFSSRTEPALTNPFILHAWLVGLRSGDVEDQKEWGTHVQDSGVYATSDGVLVKTGGLVKLYSQDFKQVRDIPLPLDASSRITVSVSWSGKTIMINQRAPRLGNAFHDRLDVFDAQSLSHRFSWDQSPPFRPAENAYSISDEGIVAAPLPGRDVLYARFGSTDWHPIFNCTNRNAIFQSPTFVTNDLIVTACGGLTVLSTEGESYSIPRSIDRNSDHDGGACRRYSFRGGNTVSSGSPIIAFTSPLFKEKKFLFREAELCLVGLEVTAFDLNLRKQVFKLNVTPPPTEAYDFALSPDGSRIAVLEDRAVSLYGIPRTPSQSYSGTAGN